jgi:hypothetical protein
MQVKNFRVSAPRIAHKKKDDYLRQTIDDNSSNPQERHRRSQVSPMNVVVVGDLSLPF